MRKLSKSEAYLTKKDPKMGQLIKRQQLLSHSRPKDYFESLCRSIIGQQLSVKAAQTIFNRFADETSLKPKLVASMNEEQAKRIGLSRQKASYLKDLASHFVTDPKVYNHLESLHDDAIIADLTAIKGVGVWTAQMFLMFTLNRPDVFAPDDAGLQKAMMQLYGWKTVPDKLKLTKIAEKWSPYRTTACMHLWQSLDNVLK